MAIINNLRFVVKPKFIPKPVIKNIKVDMVRLFWKVNVPLNEIKHILLFKNYDKRMNLLKNYKKSDYSPYWFIFFTEFIIFKIN